MAAVISHQFHHKHPTQNFPQKFVDEHCAQNQQNLTLNNKMTVYLCPLYFSQSV
jgi:hypothetical protein